MISPTQRRFAGVIGDVSSPYRITIASGSGEGREIAVGAKIFSEHQPESVKQAEASPARVGRSVVAYCSTVCRASANDRSLGFGTSIMTVFGFYRSREAAVRLDIAEEDLSKAKCPAQTQKRVERGTR